MTDTLDVERDVSPITSPDDPRVGKDDPGTKYYLKDQDGKPENKTILVFVGASLGSVNNRGVLHIKVDPAAVKVRAGEKLRWIIHDLNGQKDLTSVQIVPGKGWAFEDASAEELTATRGDGKGYVETQRGRIDPAPDSAKSVVGDQERVRGKYTIKIEFQENEQSPILKATIDPDVVYNPPGF